MFKRNNDQKISKETAKMNCLTDYTHYVFLEPRTNGTNEPNWSVHNLAKLRQDYNVQELVY